MKLPKPKQLKSGNWRIQLQIDGERYSCTGATKKEAQEKAGCNPSSLWRYRRKVEYFRRAPLSVVANCLRMANVSNQDLRYILGLPTGQHDGN